MKRNIQWHNTQSQNTEAFPTSIYQHILSKNPCLKDKNEILLSKVI